MTKQLLGFFDSGLGGLTVLRRVLERHGPVPCVYLGDTARVPYGNRQPDDIRRIAAEVVGWLRDQKVSMVTFWPATPPMPWRGMWPRARPGCR